MYVFIRQSTWCNSGAPLPAKSFESFSPHPFSNNGNPSEDLGFSLGHKSSFNSRRLTDCPQPLKRPVPYT